MTAKNIFSKKHNTLKLDGVYNDVLGEIELSGAWLIWGNEKHGKTWISLKLADYLSRFGKLLFVSAEEGLDRDFSNSCKRAGLQAHNKNLHFLEYEPIEDLNVRLSRQRAHRIIIIDNLTIYSDELKRGVLRKMLMDHNDKLFIFLAHEDRKEPYTSAAKIVRRLAKIIIYVKGFTGIVSGRCPGGVLAIDEEKAALFHSNTPDNER